MLFFLMWNYFIMNPYLEDMSEDQIKRFKKETDYMCDKWGKKLLSDKFYNDNMSYDYAFRLDRKSGE